MKDYAKLAKAKGYLGDVFKVVAGRAGSRYVADGATKPVQHTPDDLAEIRSVLWSQVQYGYINDSIDYVSPDELLRDMLKPSNFRALMRTGNVEDSFANPITGIGTWSDPGRFNMARAPVLMAPMEASAFYSNGGIPQIIIDKKCKGFLLNGYGFEGDGWTADECKQLHDYAELLSTGEALSNGLRDGLIHGGAFLYPVLQKDTPISMSQSFAELLKAGVLHKDCVHHWAEADRWNTVLVPNWDLTADDYLHPRTIYVPIGGVEVATERAAVIRPRMLDYWGMIRQIGWTTSDFEGFIRPLLGYEMIIAAIPIMAQQMSLLVHTFPMDGIIAQDGVDAAQKFIDANVAVMRAWSMVNPATINSFGELKAIERRYEGFESLVGASKVHLASSAGFPVTVIFPGEPKGLADSNEADVELKQAETVTLVQTSIRPQLAPIARIIAISCFGPTPQVMAKLSTLRFSFEAPVVQSASQRADAGGKFTAMIRDLTTAQVPLDMAFETAKLFFPDVELPKTLMDRLEQIGELDPTMQAAGLAEVERRWGPDIVQRLAQRMSDKPRPPVKPTAVSAADPMRNAVAAKFDPSADIKAAVTEKIESLSLTMDRKIEEARAETKAEMKRHESIGERLAGTFRNVLDAIGKRLTRDSQPASAPQVTVQVPKAAKQQPPNVTVTMPPINIQNILPPPGASVSRIDFEVDEKTGRIKPGTVKITKQPVGAGNGKK
jgi:hypothetical protein